MLSVGCKGSPYSAFLKLERSDPENGSLAHRLKTLQHSIAKADCVIVSNQLDKIIFTNLDDGARKIVSAINSARETGPVDLVESSDVLSFYRGTNFLGAVGLGTGSRFRFIPQNKWHTTTLPGLGTVSYFANDLCYDKTGVLGHIWDQLHPHPEGF